MINNKTFYDHTLKTLLINNFLKSSFENFRAVDKRAKVLDLTLFSFTDTGSFTLCAACAKGAYQATSLGVKPVTEGAKNGARGSVRSCLSEE